MPKKIIGIDIFINSDENLLINGSIVALKNDKLILETSLEESTTFPELFKQIKDYKLPTFLCIHGKGVLVKKISFIDGKSDKSILNTILPGTKIEDFYLEKEIIRNKEIVWVYIIKKSLFEEIKKYFDNAKKNIDGLKIGFSGINYFPKFISPNYNNEIKFTNYKLQYDNDFNLESIQSDIIRNNSENLSLNGTLINEKNLLSFVTASNFLLNLENTDLLGNQNEYKQKHLFLFYGKFALIFFFSILLINYLFFSNYNNENSTLNANLILNKEKANELKNLELEVNLKRKLLSENGLINSSRISFYADRLVYDLPEKIILTRMNINPGLFKNQNFNEKELVFDIGNIYIEGECKESYILNDWIELLKSKKWISNVSLQKISQADRSENAKFSLIINLKK